MSNCNIPKSEGVGEMMGHKAPGCMCTRVELPRVKKKDKKKDKKKRRKGYEPPSLPETFVTYEPCVHLHFKTDLIDRDCLTHDQYLDLLATPKGYRWIGEVDCENPELDINKVKRKKPKKPKKVEQIVVGPDAGDFADEFVEDMWDVMSPDITNRLIDFLVNEFGMSVEEAEDFIDCKSAAGKQTVCKKKKSKALIGLGTKHKWVKEFSDVFAKRIEQYIASMLLIKRTPRVKRIAERILDYLCDLTGVKTTLQNPKTKIQRTMVLIADRLALWIEDLMKDIDKPSKRLAITEEEEEEEEEEEKEEEKEPEEKEPAKEEPAAEKEPAKEEEAPEAEVEEKAPEAEEAEKAPEGEQVEEEAKPEEAPSPPPQEDKPEEAPPPPPPEEKPVEAPAVQEEPPKEEEPEEEEPPPPPPPPEEPEELEEAAQPTPVAEEEKPPEEETPAEEAEVDKGEAEEGEEAGEEEGEEEAEEEAEEEPLEVIPEEPIEEGPEEPEKKKEEIIKEPLKKPIGDIYDLLKEDIEGTIKDGKTDRQRAVKGVVDRRLEKIMAGRDYTDGLQKEDIDDAASRVAHWIENVVGVTEPGKGPIPRKSPGPAFQVKPKTESTLEVHKLSSATVAQEAARAKGLRAPPRERKIPTSESPMNLKSAQEWVDWATNIANVADEWGKWLDSTLSDAEKQIAEKKKEVPETDWKQWRDQAQIEARKWRVEKERIKGEGTIWDKKIEEKLKHQSETEVRSTDLND